MKKARKKKGKKK